MNSLTDSWLHCAVPHPEAGRRLVCLPHAGGSASFFREWGGHLPGIEVHAVRYPGRAEALIDVGDQAVQRLQPQPLGAGGDLLQALEGGGGRREMALRFQQYPQHRLQSAAAFAQLFEPRTFSGH